MIVTEKELINIVLQCEHKTKVVMMCGLAGEGKTTFAKKLEDYNFIRLSIDEEIWKRYGVFGKDYTEEEYVELQSLAEKMLIAKFQRLLESKQNIVVDFSFWQKKKRYFYKQIIEKYNGKWFLIYMNTPIKVIKDRLKIRNKRVEANAAFPISDLKLTNYIKSFQIPIQENHYEIVQDNDLGKS